jgi:hypothetical protein
MATESTVQSVFTDVPISSRPYSASWIDRLMAWIERIPGSPWLFYAVAFLLIALVSNGLHWLDGTLPLGQLHLTRLSDALFPVYFPALMHYLNRVAGKALISFRPLLNVTDSEVARLGYELTTIPAWVGRVSALGGLLFGVVAVASDPPSFGIEAASPLVTILFEVALTVVSAAFLFGFMYHTVHQLRLVNRIHRTATRINLFSLAPTYAFSALTARTGIGLIFFSYYLVIQNQAETLTTGLGIALVMTIMLLGVASFVLPLNNMHRLLAEEKIRLIEEADLRLESMLSYLYKDVDNQEMERMDGLNKGITSLVTTREVLKKISTWPWETSTSQAVATAIFLPIILWLLTRLLDRLITF